MAKTRPRAPRPDRSPPPKPDPPNLPVDAARAAEWFRRAALGLCAALACARVLWPSEARYEPESGNGLGWILLLLAATGLGLAALWLEGRNRIRWAWPDLAFLLLIGLVASSIKGAAEKRIAINLGWEWVALGAIYLMLRWLPRTRAESLAVLWAWIAMAVAVALYGLFQVGFEQEQLRERYRRDPVGVLRQAGVPFDSASKQRFEDRLLGSREPYATFALANSLAGYLVGPLVLLIAVMAHRVLLNHRLSRDDRLARAGALAAASIALLILAACLALTKSRSAYVGLFFGSLCAFAPFFKRKHGPSVVAFASGLALLVFLVVGIAIATCQLDLQVLTESTKSLSYRAEFWRGAWGVIQEKPWSGHGPGNFGGPYLRHKLPESSEEIREPHNALLEIWSTAGLPALLAFLASVVLFSIDLFAPGAASGPPPPSTWRSHELPPFWLIASGGSALFLVLALGTMNLLQSDSLARWLCLLVGYGFACLILTPLARSGPIPASATGAAMAAMGINLLAAEGITIPAVALGFWLIPALGLNLCDDRPCGQLRLAGGRWVSTILLAVWAALVGTFWGTVSPHWRATEWLERGDAALRPPRVDLARADQAYRLAAESDVYATRPWLARANLEFQTWQSNPPRPGEFRWARVDSALRQAMTPPRNPRSASIQQLRMQMARAALARSEQLLPQEVSRIKQDLADAARSALALHPSDARLAAVVAEALAVSGDAPGAVNAGRRALELDRRTPHQDRQLEPAVRTRLERLVPLWEKGELGPVTPTTPNASGAPS
jgi:O-antigen ligase